MQLLYMHVSEKVTICNTTKSNNKKYDILSSSLALYLIWRECPSI